MTLDSELSEELAEWRRGGLTRSLRALKESSGVHVLLDGRPVLSLGSNNYLGLANHPEVRAAAVACIERVGLGSGGARLTTGNYPEHGALERELADWQGTEDAMLFESGYAANIGVIPALLGRGDLILSDSLNHASLIDGCRLSRAEVRVYGHRDVETAAALLNDRAAFRRCAIVTDGVFSMDGDLAPLPELCTLAERQGAFLIVDDAHGGGVLGPEGAGTISLPGVDGRVAVRIGTMSKALGASGGFAAGSRALCEYLRHRARSFVYSTAPPPAVAAGALAALRLTRQGDALREKLHDNAEWLRSVFRLHGWTVPDGQTAIIPVMVGDAAAAVLASERLLAAGVLVPAIRPPTVPRGSARLRVTASAALTIADRIWIEKALNQL
ncbi:MAG: 8-amino-7-oxononanoate synthase [Armatimonadota bacterium]|nr:8-amino-7-oxononanoate synthase [Armatimonadota bacterium]